MKFFFFFPQWLLLTLALYVLWPLLRDMRSRQGVAPIPVFGMSREDACRILGVSLFATQEEIEAAFRRQMRQHHPDIGGSEEAASLLNQARDLLRRPF